MQSTERNYRQQQEDPEVLVQGDLILWESLGIAIQRDLHTAVPVPYDLEYFQKYCGYEGSQIACAINRGRVALVQRYCPDRDIVDIGIGSGEFLRACDAIRKASNYGFDVNPHGIDLLKKRERFLNPYDGLPRSLGAMTCWDSLEHLRDPSALVRCLYPGQFIFLSLPIFEDLHRVRESKHYRPNEHFYYFTDRGLVRWFKGHGFVLVEKSSFEIAAGREAIYSYVFLRIDPRDPS